MSYKVNAKDNFHNLLKVVLQMQKLSLVRAG